MRLIGELLGARELAPPRCATFEVVGSESLTDSATALQALKDFGGRGWVCFTDEVVELDGAALQRGGIPLSAELCTEAESLHLRQEGSGWRLVRMATREGSEHLVFTERRERLGGGTLTYEVAWRRDEDTWRPWCARLSGFTKKGEA
ncbi:MAG: hypothetical protein QM311_07355 [Acidobacteriota bacterium]|nr:hypothetical protein [Acidobacteriota bacterium]